MNDRYLYRAKHSLNSKKWHIGNLVEEPDGLYLRDNKNNIMVYIQDESTICQCSGLKDKNGNMIWENDIVDLYDRNTDYKWRAVVRFGNPNYEYTWGWQLEPIGKCEANTDILCWIEMEESGATCEVIGNIFDNPEL